MILNKKGLVVLPLVALLFASCSKSMSYEETVKFVNENYTSKETKTAKAVTEVQGKAANELSKATLKTLYPSLDDNLYYSTKYDTGVNVFNVASLDALRTQYGADGLTYSSKGKELTISFNGKVTVGGYSVTEKDQYQYNSEGYAVKGYSESSVKTEEYDFSLVQSIVYTY